MPSHYDDQLKDLKRQEALATVAQLTGDPVLGEFGTAAQRGIAGRRKSLREAMEARRKFESARPSGMPGYVLRAGQVEPVQEYLDWQAQQKQADREYRLKAAMMGRRSPDEWYARERWKRTVPTASQAAEARKTLAYLPELQSLAQELQAEGVEIPTGPEVTADIAREYLPGGSAAAAGIERAGFTPESMRWLERGRQAESDIIRLASGLAVTGFELENVKKWSPWAANLTKEQRTDRIRNIYNKLGREATAIQGNVWQDAPMQGFAPAPGAPTGAGAPPPRPEGLTNEEWEQFLQIEGYNSS